MIYIILHKVIMILKEPFVYYVHYNSMNRIYYYLANLEGMKGKRGGMEIIAILFTCKWKYTTLQFVLYVRSVKHH